MHTLKHIQKIVEKTSSYIKRNHNTFHLNKLPHSLLSSKIQFYLFSPLVQETIDLKLEFILKFRLVTRQSKNFTLQEEDKEICHREVASPMHNHSSQLFFLSLMLQDIHSTMKQKSLCLRTFPAVGNCNSLESKRREREATTCHAIHRQFSLVRHSSGLIHENIIFNPEEHT